MTNWLCVPATAVKSHSARDSVAAPTRDFVPWRFSDTGHLSARMVPSSQRAASGATSLTVAVYQGDQSLHADVRATPQCVQNK